MKPSQFPRLRHMVGTLQWSEYSLLPGLRPSPLPSEPGVYLFGDNRNHILYVGKAKRLAVRLRSYWDPPSLLDSKTRLLIKNSVTLRTIQTPSEFEAVLLEAHLIREFKPKFNARLKDDKSPLYIEVTGGAIPSIRVKRKSDLRTSSGYVFGPFLSSRTTDTILRTIRTIFPYCSKQRADGKPCFWWHLGLCPGFCVGIVSILQYRRMIRRIVMLLSGKIDELLRTLEGEMTRAARVLRFEEAANAKSAMDALVRIRSLTIDTQGDPRSEDRPLRELRALARELTRLAISLPVGRSTRIEGYDVSTLGGHATTGSMVVFTGGVPDITEYRHFRISSLEKPDDPRALAQVLERRLTHLAWPTPNLVLIDGGAPQLVAVQKHFRVTSQLPSGAPFIGLEKRTESLVIPISLGKFSRVSLEKSHPGLLLLMHVRDEAHRFARRYHHNLRRRMLLVYNGRK